MTGAPDPTLDRHALVTALWLAAALIAVTLFHYGLGAGGTVFVLAAFGVILAAFVGHLIVNAVFSTVFSPRELALGLVLYVTALAAFGVAALLAPGFRAAAFLPVGVGFAVLFAGVVSTMLVRTGARGAFDAFDVVRTFGPPRRGRAE